MRKIESFFWLVGVVWALLAVTPASFWYDAGHMRIDDIQAGDDLELIYSGGAKHSFTGSYSVILRDAETRVVVGEDRSAPFQYDPAATRPPELTIEWWAPGNKALHNLPVGTYRMDTCWTVHGVFFGLVPGKTTCVSSNIFRVEIAK